MSEWKESSIKKRDFQHSKSDPQVAKSKQKKKGKYTHKLVIKGWNGMFGDENDEYVFGKYRALKGAEQAKVQKENDRFWGKHEIVIEEL